jgi:hypothetical protein
MKLTKQHWMIIGVVIALIASWYFFLRKKKPAESGYNPYILVPEAGNWIDNSEPGGESAYSKGAPGSVLRGPNRCVCSSGNETGICVQNNGFVSCQGSVILPEVPPPSESNFRTKTKKPKCPSGTVLSTCYGPDNVPFQCCGAKNI